MSDDLSEAEIAADMIAAAEFFDADFYAETYPKVAEGTDDLLEEFCRQGWRELRNPSSTFDIWWYWTNHLDPASESINPLVHYAQVGRAAELSTKPDPCHPRHGELLPTDRPVRRACLFAGFDVEGVVDDAVLLYLRELARFGDVFCLFDCYLPTAEIDKLRTVVTDAWAIRHGAYDVGSYSLLARELVGWEKLSTYDEVLFVNDSCYLLRPLAEVFARMDAEACDWWGLQATKGLAITSDAPANQFNEPIPLEVIHQSLLAVFEQDAIYDFHLASYFLAFRRPVLDDPVFRRLIDSISAQGSKLAIIQKYEIGLTHLLVGRGHAFSTFVPALYPFHPVFSDWAFDLIARGFPLLKRYFLYQNHYDTPGLARWKERVLELVPDAPVEVFEENLQRTAPADRLHRSYAIERDRDGAVLIPELASLPAFVKADKAAPKRDNWWVFAVDPYSHRLPENSRAIFDLIADDPDLTKIILTRGLRINPAGANVVSVPALSPEGREYLLGSGVVFVTDRPTFVLGARVRPTLHHVIAVRRGLMLRKHGRTAGAPRPGPAEPPTEIGPVEPLHPLRRPAVTAILTASDLDQVAEISAQWPARYASGWRTGLPAHDHILAAELPADLAEQEARLRRQLAGRRLVLFVPLRRPGPPWQTYDFSHKQIAHLVAWARANDAVIGIREPLEDLERPFSAGFGDVAVDVSARRFESTATVLRVADVLWTDYDGAALDFMVTGRPVVSFAPDLDQVADRLLYDLEHLFPGPVCRDFEALAETFKTIFDPPAPAADRQYRRVSELMIDHHDGRNSTRVLERIHQLLERGGR